MISRADSHSLRIRWLSHCLALVLFVLIYGAMTYPVMIRPDHWVWGRPYEDAFESIWYLDWYAQALFELKVNPLFHPGIFYPGGWDLRFSVLPPVYPALFAPLTRVVGSVTAYNLILMLSCATAAYGAFMVGELVGANWWGSVTAGVLFAFFPQRQVYLAGHLNLLLGSMWLPWLAYGLLRGVRSSAHRTSWFALAGAAFGLSVAGASQCAFISTGLLVLLAAGLYLSDRCRVQMAVRDLRAMLSMAGVAAVLVVPLVLTSSAARGAVAEDPWSFEAADLTSVHLERVLSPSWLNPIWRNATAERWPLENGQDGVIGLSLSSLSLVLVVTAKRPRRVTLPWWFLLAGGVVLMLGLTLHAGGQTLLVPASKVLVTHAAAIWRWVAQSAYPEAWDGFLPVFLPNAFAYRLVPFYRLFHHYGRWALVASLGLAGLVTHSFASSVEGLRPWQRTAVGASLLLLVLLEYNMQPAANVTSVSAMEREVDAYLASQPDKSVIVEYPLSYSMHGQALYYTLFHRQDTIHGYASIPPKAFAQVRSQLDSWPSSQSIDLLLELGARYVVVNVFSEHQEQFHADQLPHILMDSRTNLVQCFPDSIGIVREVCLFELAP